jgi:hypothetical protein
MRARAITIFMTLAVLGAACANSGSTGSKQPSILALGYLAKLVLIPSLQFADRDGARRDQP